MSLFRAIAFVAFVVGAVFAAVNGSLQEPIFWVSAGLAAFCLAGANFDRNVG